MKSLWMLSAVVAFVGATASAHAQPYPSRYIRMVVPYAAGGATDSMARIAAEELGKNLKQSVVIDNRGGANTALGVGEVAKATPDGYTLLFIDASVALNQKLLGDKFPYDPVKDLKPIGLFATSQLVLLLNPSVPAQTLRELITHLKENPNKLNYGSGGNGSLTHLCPELFKFETGTQIAQIPYRSAGPALSDLLGGTVQIMCLGVSNSASVIETGKVRGLAITGKSRSIRLADVPTFAEAGVSSMPLERATSWFALFAPGDTPDEVVAVLNRALLKMQDSPEIRIRLTQLGVDLAVGSSDSLIELIRQDAANWGGLIDKLSIKGD